MSLTHALKWSFLSELAAKAIQPVVFIVLARLLTPEDFGVMTAAMMVIAFSQIFWEAGMGKALIQRQKDIELAANAAFMINIGLGLLIAVLLYLLAQPIAQTIFQDDRVTAVLQVMTLQVLLGALASVQTALLQKEMEFKKLFWVRFATVSLPGLASIPLAWNGWGYWALVAGTLVGQLAQVIMLWRMSHWRPSFARNRVVTREMANFGSWVGVSGLLAWFYVWIDTLIVAKYLGAHDLGLYRVGSQMASLLFATTLGSLTPVFYSYIAKKTEVEIKQMVSRGIEVIIYVSLSAGVVLYFGANILEILFFSVQWQGVGNVIGALSLTFGLTYIVTLNGEVYRALRSPSTETMVMLFALVFYMPIYLISIGYGLDKFLWARFCAGIVGVLVQLYFLKLVCGVKILRLFYVVAKVFVISVVVLLPYEYLSPRLSMQGSIILFVFLSVALAIMLYVFGGKKAYLGIRNPVGV